MKLHVELYKAQHISMCSDTFTMNGKYSQYYIATLFNLPKYCAVWSLTYYCTLLPWDREQCGKTKRTIEESEDQLDDEDS